MKLNFSLAQNFDQAFEPKETKIVSNQQIEKYDVVKNYNRLLALCYGWHYDVIIDLE